jgi:diguanylate cyclase (GGDEF)-like protein
MAHRDVYVGRSLRLRIVGALIAASLLLTAVPGPAFADVFGTGIDLPSGTLEKAVPALSPAGGQIPQLPVGGDFGGIVNQITGQVPGGGGLLLGGGGGNGGRSTPPRTSGTGPRQDATTQKPTSGGSPGGAVSKAPPSGSPAAPAQSRRRSRSAGAGPASKGRRAADQRTPSTQPPLPAGGRSSSASDGGPQLGSIVEKIVNRIPPQYRIAIAVLAGLTTLFALTTMRERRRSRRATRDSLADPLTGLANRKGFELRLEREWRRATRYDRPLGLLLLDLDDFKEINDTMGHAEGDEVLRRTANAITERGLRESDQAARIGGDEFVVLCPETSLRGLGTIAESLERTLAHLEIDASIGFAAREVSDERPADLLARADAAMYQRKRGGDPWRSAPQMAEATAALPTS